MPIVNVYKTKRGDEVVKHWLKEINALYKRGITVEDQARKGDVHIVLSGRNENPEALKGRRILFFKMKDWMVPQIWKLVYEPVIKEFYDEMYCVDSMSMSDFVEKVRMIIARA